MPFRLQYLNDIALVVNPYPAAPIARIRQIYGTARRGAITAALANQLWVTHLQPVYAGLAMLPVMQPAFDAVSIQTTLAMEATLVAAGRGGFGIAQKILNLFLKDLWAFNMIPPGVEPHLHVPIDRGVLSRLNAVPGTWDPWTLAVAGMAASPTVIDYLGIQNLYRQWWANPAAPGVSPPLFLTLIEMEQFLWHSL
jgi:hypothetical protein